MVKKNTNSKASAPPRGHLTLLILLSGLLVVMLSLLLWQLPNIHQYGAGALAFVIYVIVGLIASVITFGILHSFGSLKGQQLGMAVEIGGAAALFVIVLGLELRFEASHSSSFSVMVTLHEWSDRSKIVVKNGTIILYLPPEGAKDFKIQRGAAKIQDLAPGLRNMKVQYQINVEGYNKMDHADPLGLTPDGDLYVPVVRLSIQREQADPLNKMREDNNTRMRQNIKDLFKLSYT